ncbi:MAG: hypothetical protein E6R04_08050 [Spirochaetes bacterium]|nr:MAG: hypothetical protein E6R04_08050 [Spirochaetota bacterium]
MQPNDRQQWLQPQDPCPTCGEPMDGVGWECGCGSDVYACRDSACWIGPRPRCAEHGEPARFQTGGAVGGPRPMIVDPAEPIIRQDDLPPTFGDGPDDLARITNHDLETLRSAHRMAKEAVERRDEKVVALTAVLQRVRHELEVDPDGHSRHDIIRSIGNALGLFGASNLAVERWEANAAEFRSRLEGEFRPEGDDHE